MKRFAALVLLLGLGACAEQIEASRMSLAACRAPLKAAIQVDLYFGRDKGGKGEVSETEWADFLTEVVTPLFPDGLSVLNVRGQYRHPAGTLVRERSKLMTIVVFDAPNHLPKVQQITSSYTQRFAQHGVFRVEKPVCAGM